MERIERLKQVVDTYGGDPAHWPVDEREALSALAAQSSEIKAQLMEARALDAVLRAAPGAEESRLEALRHRILAGVGPGATGGIPPDSHVVPLPRTGRRPVPAPAPLWAAAALAASLFAGVFLGASELGSPAIEGLVGIAGIEAEPGVLDLLEVSDVELL